MTRPLYFDESVEVIKLLLGTRATDIFTNSVTGKTVTNRGVFQELFTRIDGTDEFTPSLVATGSWRRRRARRRILPGERSVLRCPGLTRAAKALDFELAEPLLTAEAGLCASGCAHGQSV